MKIWGCYVQHIIKNKKLSWEKKFYDAQVVWPFGRQTNENRFSGLYKMTENK